MRQRQLRAQIGAAAIDLLHKIIALHLQRLNPAQVDRAGVVDKNVDPAKLPDRRLHRERDLFLEANVASDR